MGNPRVRAAKRSVHDTEPNYIQVNQMTMDMLCTAGVTRPQAINGPGDGEPEYLVPCDIYVRAITTPTSVVHANVNDAQCTIDPSLLEAMDTRTSPPQESSGCPRPQRLVGGKRTKDPIARARARALAALGLGTAGSAMVGLAVVESATGGLAVVESAVVESAMGGLATVVGSAAGGSAMGGSATG